MVRAAYASVILLDDLFFLRFDSTQLIVLFNSLLQFRAKCPISPHA
jgi:hypothetical protein